MTYGGHKVGILLLLPSALTLGCPFSERAISDSGGAGSGNGGGSATSSSSASSASSSGSVSSGSGGGGGGAGVPCMTAPDCPGKDDECQTRTCTGGFCGLDFKPFGTPTSAQTALDCKVTQCDGSGMAITIADSMDLPVDNNQCTLDVCSAGGVPSNPNAPAGTACNENGGTKCNGNGKCVP